MNPVGSNLLLFSALSFLPASSVPAALDQLSPEFYDIEKQIVFQQAHSFVNALHERGGPAYGDSEHAGYYGGFQTANSAGLDLAAPGLAAPVVGPLAPVEPTRTYVNAGGFDNYARQDTQANDLGRVRTGYTDHDSGLRLSVEHRLSPDTTVGLLAAHNDTDGTFDQPGGLLHAESTSFGPFLSYIHDGFFLDAAFWHSEHRFDVNRVIELPGLTSPLLSSDSARSNSAFVGGGKMWTHGAWAYGPTASLEWTSAQLGAFTESGGAGALTVDGRSDDSVRSLIGGRIARQFPVEDGLIVPELRLRWAHEFADDNRNIIAQFSMNRAQRIAQARARKRRKQVQAQDSWMDELLSFAGRSPGA